MTPLLEALYRVQSAGGPEAFLLDLALKGSAVLITGFLAALALRRATAAARHLAWCATFGALVLLPVLVAWAPALELAVVPGVSSRASDLGRRQAPPLPGTGDPSPHAGTAPSWRVGEDLASSRGGAGPAGAEASGGPVAATVEGTSASPWARSGRWLAAVYLAGALALLGYLALGALRARSLRRGARRLESQPGWRELLDALRALAGVHRPVILEATDRVAVPLAWGARRPRIVLPARAGAWDGGQRREVLLHELAHVARHDWLSQTLARVGCALFWFHPLAWMAARRLILEAERACDDRVLEAGADSCDYADRLLRVAGSARRVPDASYAAVAMARRSDLATRIESILDGRTRRGAPGRPMALLMVAALLAPAAALGPARIARAGAAAGPAASPGGDVSPGLMAGAHERDRDEDTDRDAERSSRTARPSGGSLPPLLAAAGSGDLAEVR
ncbi:MAG: M56 family metallopeptidase, partial [Thermoanaerobaculia bacterium]